MTSRRTHQMANSLLLSRANKRHTSIWSPGLGACTYPTMDSTSSSLSKLPAELRHQIWRLAANPTTAGVRVLAVTCELKDEVAGGPCRFITDADFGMDMLAQPGGSDAFPFSLSVPDTTRDDDTTRSNPVRLSSFRSLFCSINSSVRGVCREARALIDAARPADTVTLTVRRRRETRHLSFSPANDLFVLSANLFRASRGWLFDESIPARLATVGDKVLRHIGVTYVEPGASCNPDDRREARQCLFMWTLIRKMLQFGMEANSGSAEMHLWFIDHGLRRSGRTYSQIVHDVLYPTKRHVFEVDGRRFIEVASNDREWTARFKCTFKDRACPSR